MKKDGRLMDAGSPKQLLNLFKQALVLLANCLPACCMGRSLVKANPLAWTLSTHVHVYVYGEDPVQNEDKMGPQI